MENNIMVSVICNTFNHEAYVRDALEGFVTQQTDFPIEVLVHDDASTDGTANIIREYEARYPELIFPIYQTVNQYSQKVRITKTFQLPRVRGKYIAFCEGDDCWTDPKKLQKQVDFLEAHPDYSMCVCSASWLDMKSGRIIKHGTVEQDCDVTMEDIIIEKRGRMFQFASFVVRTEVWQNEPSWKKAFSVGDTSTAIQAAVAGKVRMLADNMCLYRWRSPGSFTAKVDNRDKRIYFFGHTIGAFEVFDRETDGAYHELVEKRIRMLQYKIAMEKGDFKALKSGDLAELYYQKSFILRLGDRLHCKHPRLYARLRKVLKLS